MADNIVPFQTTSGISAAGGITLSSSIVVPSGSTLTVSGNLVANGNVNLGDATTDSITVAGSFNANTGISAAGGTFSALTRFTAGISASGITSSSYVLSSGGIVALTGTTYTFLGSDNGEVLTMNNASGITATVPTGLPVGYSVTVIQLGAGQVGFTAASGVTLNSYTSLRKIAGQHGSASLVSYQTNVFNLAGNLA